MKARSSLAAFQRQEKQTRNFLESKISDLQQRIFKLEVGVVSVKLDLA